MAYLVCDDIRGYLGGKHQEYFRGQKISRKEASQIPNLQILVNVGKLREVQYDSDGSG